MDGWILLIVVLQTLIWENCCSNSVQPALKTYQPSEPTEKISKNGFAASTRTSAFSKESSNNVEIDWKSQVDSSMLSRASKNPWINEKICGTPVTKQVAAYQPRIINGSDSTKGKWPWQAMLLRFSPSSGTFYFTCGGSLIHNKWVLTASHCFSSELPSYTQVALGAHFKTFSGPNVKVVAISQKRCHNSYLGSINAFKDDICLLKLAGHIHYTDHIRPACLPTVGTSIPEGSKCSITGWGETYANRHHILQEANVKIISKMRCQSWYRQSSVTLPEKHICAGDARGYVDSCQGDSGGPLSCQDSSTKSSAYFVNGITSFGIGCAVAQRPGVYTGVENYIDWIQATVTMYSSPDECFTLNQEYACDSTVTENGTVIHSPVVNTESWIYPKNKRCTWNIQAPTGCQILLEFMCFFHVEANTANYSQCFDFLKVESAKIGFQAVFCGESVLKPIRLKSDTATMSFMSDASVQFSGFVVKVLFLKESPNLTTADYSSTTAYTIINKTSDKRPRKFGGNNSNSLHFVNLNNVVYSFLLFFYLSR